MTVSLGDYTAEFAKKKGDRKRALRIAGGVAGAGLVLGAGAGYLATRGKGAKAAARMLGGTPARPALPAYAPNSIADPWSGPGPVKIKSMMPETTIEVPPQRLALPPAATNSAGAGGRVVKSYTRSDGTLVRGYNRARSIAYRAGIVTGKAAAITGEATRQGLRRDAAGRRIFGDVLANTGQAIQKGYRRELRTKASIRRSFRKWRKKKA